MSLFSISMLLFVGKCLMRGSDARGRTHARARTHTRIGKLNDVIQGDNLRISETQSTKQGDSAQSHNAALGWVTGFTTHMHAHARARRPTTFRSNFIPRLSPTSEHGVHLRLHYLADLSPAHSVHRERRLRRAITMIGLCITVGVHCSSLRHRGHG